MQKVDFKKTDKDLYNPKKEPALANVPKMKFFAIEGQGDPGTSAEFQEAIEALYGASFTLKFALKKNPPAGFHDWVIPPMEGHWWMAGEAEFDPEEKDLWCWKIMIRQPDFVTEDMLKSTIAELQQKKENESLSKLQFFEFEEGESIQILHIGSYDDEGPTIQKIYNLMEDKGLKMNGRHHEIYLSDPRKTAPEKLRTVIRQPVK